MTTKEKRPVPAKRKSAHPIEQSHSTKLPSKKRRVLTALIDGKSFHRFEAEKLLNDHCLHSTVAELQNCGVIISRKSESVPGYQGIDIRVMRYWIAPEHKARAEKVLGRLR